MRVSLRPETAAYLVRLARRGLEEAVASRSRRPDLVSTRVGPRPDDPALDRPGRLFVTWHHRGTLVGCLGQLEPTEPLARAVARLAVDAAIHDPRTPGATPEILPSIDGEISLLSEPRPLDAVGLAAIARRLVPGRDGLLLECDGRRAFFLPQVWEQLPEPARFLAALVRKGGMDPERAAVAARGSVFEAEVLPIPPAADAPPAGVAGSSGGAR